MRAVVIEEDRRLRLSEVSEWVLGPRGLRLEVAFCGICGSDLHNQSMPDIAPAGTVLGHEFAGLVSEVGAEAEGFSVGDLVTVLPFEYCGSCERCAAGFEHLCLPRAETKIGGAVRYGAYAESVVVPCSTAFLVPDGVPAEHAALTEPLAVGVHGVAVAAADPEAGAVVLGAGPIGVMTAIALRAAGFDRIVAVEPNPQRRARMADLGPVAVEPEEAAATIERLLGGPPPVVFDCTGHPSGPGLALGLLPARGKLVMLGITIDPAPVDMIALVGKEIEMIGAVAYTHEEFGRALDQIAAGQVPCKQIITAVRPLEEADAAFDDLLSGSSDDTKVLLRP